MTLRKKFATLIAFVLITSSTNVFSCTEDGSEGFLPENKLFIPADAKLNAELTEEVFNEVISKVEAVYKPIVSSMGGDLIVRRNWTDGTVNAYAQRQGSSWIVQMFGGLARHETITPDGFALVVCHEVGHHIGGAPKKVSFYSNAWASNEGQSDYFATAKCLRKVFLGEDHQAVLAKLTIPQTLIDSCAATFANEEEQLICQRGGMAGMSTAKLFQALRGQSTEPQFDTPDAKVVSKTDDNHPATQCRLDTYYNGAICAIADSIDVDQKDEKAGVCNRIDGYTSGVRPLCWFAPKRR